METIYIGTRELPETIQSVLKEIGYNRRDIAVTAKEKVSLLTPGGNGIRGFVVLINLETGEHKRHYGSWGGANIFNPNNAVDLDDRYHNLPVNGAVIRGSEGGSRPVSAELILHPDNQVKLLPVEEALSDRMKTILYIFKGLKSFCRKEYLAKLSATPEEIDSLVASGYLRRTKVGISITTEGKNALGSWNRYY